MVAGHIIDATRKDEWSAVEKFPKCSKLETPNLVKLNNVKIFEKRSINHKWFINDFYIKIKFYYLLNEQIVFTSEQMVFVAEVPEPSH